MEELREMIIRHEDFRDHVYLDTEGNPTGGYGHHFYPGSRLSREIAERLLDMDLANTAAEFLKIHPDKTRRLNTARRRVICDMIFNMGLKRVLEFRRMWTCVEAEDWNGAAREMMDSVWANQVKGRAVELAKIMREGKCSS